MALGLVLAVGVGGRGAHVVIDANNLYGVAPRAQPVAAQEDGEGLAKVCIKGIDDGIEGGVGPAKPHKYIKGGGADTGELSGAIWEVDLTERNHAVQDEEGQPAAHKHPHDHRECLQDFGFSLEGHFEGAFTVHAGAVAHATVAVFGTLCGTLQGRYSSDLFLSNPVDPCVSHDHYGYRDVEAY